VLKLEKEKAKAPPAEKKKIAKAVKKAKKVVQEIAKHVAEK